MPQSHHKKEAEKLLSQTRSLSQRVAAHTKRLYSELDSIQDEVGALLIALKNAEDETCSHLGTANSEELSEWSEVSLILDQAKGVMISNGPGGDLRRFTKVKKPFLLNIFLGRSADIHSMRKEDSIRVKEEYHVFRNNSAYTMFTFALILHIGLMRAKYLLEHQEALSLTPVFMAMTQLFLCWMLFFYTASALRESILKCNGSYIRAWWIHHHYWSIATCCLMLSLPVDSPSFVKAIQMFLWWAMLQAVVMVLQNRYQRRRMYTRIALGKNSAMDVVSGESSGIEGQLLVLIPMLFGLQVLQGYIGIEMIRQTYWALLTPQGFLDPENKDLDLWGSRGVALAGAMMLHMAFRNFEATMATVIKKKTSKERAALKLQALKSQAEGGHHTKHQ